MEIVEQATAPTIPDQPQLPKIFREKAIYGATFIGGPLAAGYIIAHNYKVFGEKKKAQLSWVISVLFTVLILGIALNLPESVKIPNQLIPLIYTGVAYVLVHRYQGKLIEKHLQKGAQWFTGWRVTGVTAIALIITVAVVFAYILFTDPTLSLSSKSYGASADKIYYQKGNVSEAEVDKIAKSLEEPFSDEGTVEVLLTKVNNTYEISFAMMENSWNEPGTIAYFEQLRNFMQWDYPSNPIVINLSSQQGYDDVKKVLK